MTIENTMDPDGLACTLRSTDDYGWCTSIAIHFGETTPVPLLQHVHARITLHASRADSRRLLPEVIDWSRRAASTRPPSRPRSRAWDDAAEAWLEPAIEARHGHPRARGAPCPGVNRMELPKNSV